MSNASPLYGREQKKQSWMYMYCTDRAQTLPSIIIGQKRTILETCSSTHAGVYHGECYVPSLGQVGSMVSYSPMWVLYGARDQYLQHWRKPQTAKKKRSTIYTCINMYMCVIKIFKLTWGRSFMLSWWANMALVKRLVNCSAKAAL